MQLCGTMAAHSRRFSALLAHAGIPCMQPADTLTVGADATAVSSWLLSTVGAGPAATEASATSDAAVPSAECPSSPCSWATVATALQKQGSNLGVRSGLDHPSRRRPANMANLPPEAPRPSVLPPPDECHRLQTTLSSSMRPPTSGPALCGASPRSEQLAPHRSAPLGPGSPSAAAHPLHSMSRGVTGSSSSGKTRMVST